MLAEQVTPATPAAEQVDTPDMASEEQLGPPATLEAEELGTPAVASSEQLGPPAASSEEPLGTPRAAPKAARPTMSSEQLGSPPKTGAASNAQPFSYPKGMPKSVSHILCSSKGSAMRDLHHSHSKHVERLKNMKPMVDMSLNPGFKMNNAKKEQEAAERNATIERENKLLLSKMYTIMNADNPYLNTKVEKGQKSLNMEKRRQEYDRIARENQV